MFPLVTQRPPQLPGAFPYSYRLEDQPYNLIRYHLHKVDMTEIPQLLIKAQNSYYGKDIIIQLLDKSLVNEDLVEKINLVGSLMPDFYIRVEWWYVDRLITVNVFEENNTTSFGTVCPYTLGPNGGKKLYTLESILSAHDKDPSSRD